MDKNKKCFCKNCKEPIFWKTIDRKPIAFDDQNRMKPHECPTEGMCLIMEDETDNFWICDPCESKNGSCGEWKEDTETFKQVKVVHGKHKGWKKGKLKPSPKKRLEEEATAQLHQILNEFLENHYQLKGFSDLDEDEFTVKFLKCNLEMSQNIKHQDNKKEFVV